MEGVIDYQGVPPLPSYELKTLPPLLSFIPDKILVLLVPVVTYWSFSLFFHYIDVNDYFAKYRLHTPAEVLKRNRVSVREVVKEVLIQHVIQTVAGYLFSLTEPEDMYGKEEYDVAVWAQRIRLAQRTIPSLLAGVGIDSASLAGKLLTSYPTLAGLLAGGNYPWITKTVFLASGKAVNVPDFANWELLYAKAVYWVGIPAIQFLVGILIVDTWQYFLHRGMHMNQYLYRTLHSRHHRLYVPYAFGALYNHPIEGFLLDTVGAGLAYTIAGLTTRQGMVFFMFATLKTCDDHCGYALPWDPLQLLFKNNAPYHDIHHQGWGIKPFFIFWDQLLGTAWTGGDISSRYARASEAAEKAINAEKDVTAFSDPVAPYDEPTELLDKTVNENLKPFVEPNTKSALQAAASRDQVLTDTVAGGESVLIQEAEEEEDAESSGLRRSPRKKRDVGSLRGLTERVNGSIHGRGSSVLGMENHS